MRNRDVVDLVAPPDQLCSDTSVEVALKRLYRCEKEAHGPPEDTGRKGQYRHPLTGSQEGFWCVLTGLTARREGSARGRKKQHGPTSWNDREARGARCRSGCVRDGDLAGGRADGHDRLDTGRAG